MTAGDTYRDMALPDEPSMRDPRGGRACVAVIGIDRYHEWNRLYNAVSDANGALNLFLRLGFEPVGAPLFDEMATGDALRRLASDDLAGLSSEDSLVLFFAGHGHTVNRTYYGGTSVKDGYLIPVDGDGPGGRAGTWLRLESWLTDVTRIPAKHILVILDACHSGLALGPIIQWRSRGLELPRKEPLEHLRARRSRRIITSALDDQLAMDGGPVPGHSLFTGCLIEAMTGGLVASTGQGVVTGSEIGNYVQRRVSEYPRSMQTPDFGALELDDRGELLVHVAMEVGSVDGAQATAESATLEGADQTTKLYVPAAERPPDFFGGDASGLPHEDTPQTGVTTEVLARQMHRSPLQTALTTAALSNSVGDGSNSPRRRRIIMMTAGIATIVIIKVVAMRGSAPSPPTASHVDAAIVSPDTRVAADAAPIDAAADAQLRAPPDAMIDARPMPHTTPRKIVTDAGVRLIDAPFLEPAETDDKPLPPAR